LSLKLMAGLPWLGIATAGLLLLLMRVPRCPATLLALGMAVALARLAGVGAPWPGFDWAPAWPTAVVPDFGDFQHALASAVLPQLPLTLTNAVLVTAARPSCSASCCSVSA
jgi:hypothetical protein